MTERDHRNPETDDHIDFKKLVFEHQDRVLNTCYRFVHNREDADVAIIKNTGAGHYRKNISNRGFPIPVSIDPFKSAQSVPIRVPFR